MKSIFVFDEHLSSKFNGVGAFMNAIFSCVKKSNMQLNLISFNEEVTDFSIEKHDGHVIYKYPMYGGLFVENALPALSILKLYVNDSHENIFLSSYCPSHILLKTIKTLFPKSKRISIIHDQGWTSPLQGNSELYKEILSHRRLKDIDYGVQKFIKAFYKKELVMYRLSHHIVCLSPSTRKLLQEIYQVPTEKISMIPNGIDVKSYEAPIDNRAEIRNHFGISEDEIVLIFAGRVVKAKGIYQLLDAFEKIWHSNHKLRLVIAGITDGIEDYTKHVHDSIFHVTFTGLISKSRLHQWYRAADIGVLPSYTEQCSYSGMEMMAEKLLVVTTDGNSLRDMFNSSNAYIVKANEDTMAEELACKLQEALMATSEEREEKTNAAFERVKKVFSLERMQASYSKMLNLL